MKQARLNPFLIEKIKMLPSDFLQDLAWLLTCDNIHHEKFPHTISFNLMEEGNVVFNWLKNITSSPQKADFDTLPLGKYTEQLLRFYFEKHPDFNLHAFNQQLIDSGVTLGEIDYLIENIPSKQFYHLELAIKYYLKVERNGKLIFLGPSTKDWFERKVEKLNQQQLKLLSKHRNILPEAIQNKEYKTRVLIKGSLFYPWHEWVSMKIDPAIRGWWVHENEVEKLLTQGHFYCLVIHKKEWIFPFRNKKLLDSGSTLQRLKEFFGKKRNEIMMVRYDEKKHPIDRGFVMRENWPD